MRPRWRLAVTVLAGLYGLVGAPAPAAAAEYRLNVANIYEGGFASFMGAKEWNDGASGPGLNRLEASLDRGDLGKGVLIYDRHVQPASELVARAYGAVPVAAKVLLGGDGVTLWDEARWEGKPGEVTAWLIRPSSRLPQALTRTALKGNGPLRQFQPYGTPAGQKVAAVRVPLNFISFGEERGNLWQKALASRVDLGNGLAAVVAANDNLSFPDQAVLLVSQGAEPTTYKAVLAWRLRSTEQQSPGDNPIIRMRWDRR